MNPLRILCLGGFLATVQVCSGSPEAATAPASAPREPTTHTLFLGADVGVELDGKVRPVQDVENRAFVVDVDNRRVAFRPGASDLRIQVVSVMKVTASYATLTGLTAERDYTMAADPIRRVHQSIATAMDAAEAATQADYTFSGQELVVKAGSVGTPAPDGRPNLKVIDQGVHTGSFNVMSGGTFVHHASGDAVSDAVANGDAKSRDEKFDAFRLAFEVSSATPLNDPYIVVIVRFRERPDDAATARMMVTAQRIPAIGRQPQTVTMFRGGYPPGYQLESYQVHLYNHGVEVATTVAAKQMALTRDDALQFYIIDYATRNRDRSVPPSPARMFWSSDLSPRLKSLPADLALFVRVGKDGRPRGVFEDAACEHPVDDAGITTTIGDLRFFPGLSKGKPVETVTPVKVADLVL